MVLILVDQSELWKNKLKLQRIDMYCILPHMDRSETESYVRSYLDYAGCPRELFTSKTLDEVYRGSAGIPRMVNRVCEKALMYGFRQYRATKRQITRAVTGPEGKAGFPNFIRLYP